MRDVWTMLLAAAMLAGSPRSGRQAAQATPSTAPPAATTATLTIDLEPGLCRRQPLVTLATASGMRKVSVAPPACDAVVRGLVPDTYLVRWQASDSSWGEAVERVVAGDTHRVRLSDAPYVVGRITIGDEVPSGLAVSFGPPVDGPLLSRPPVTVDVAADGTYRADLPEPGAYFVQLRSQQLMVPGQGHHLAVRAGRNLHDWPIPPGTLSIDLGGWDRASEVSLLVRRQGAVQHGIVAHGVKIPPTQPLPLIIPGVPPGTYDVFARQARTPPMTSDTAVAQISADSPEARLMLTLTGQYVRLRVVDEQQQPVRGAQVLTPDERLVEIGPGLFSLENGRRGGPMHIRAPGLVPVCRWAPLTGATKDLTVVLDAGRPVLLRVLGVGAISEPPITFIWDGVDCPVYPADVEFRVRPGSPSGGTEFEMPHFPREDVRYVGMGAPKEGTPIEVVDGVAVLRLRP
ncbi:MAG: hypothetical protein ACHQRO_04790 [Vicinamibacteria bacterium]